jgi:hypothetical protein
MKLFMIGFLCAVALMFTASFASKQQSVDNIFDAYLARLTDLQANKTPLSIADIGLIVDYYPPEE